MSLLSTLAAHDLGYLSTAALLDRLDATADHARGSRALPGPLPELVRHGDPGAAAPALRLDRRQRQPRRRADRARAGAARARRDTRRRVAQRLAGLADTADLLAAASSASDAGSGPGAPSPRSIVSRARSWPRREAHARRSRRRASQALAPQLAARGRPPLDTPGPADPGTTSRYWCRAVLDAIAGGDRASQEALPAALRTLASRLSALADAMRFDFLYDRRRRIFSIGYRLADADGPGRPDGVFYDLLASEARLASFVAIAKGDVPQHHWFHLGRLVTNVDGRATLMSWGGTMFEYLMPQLLMRSFPGTLLDQSCRASVRRQIEYGRQRDVPWGISESAYAFTDRARQLPVPGVRRAGARPQARPCRPTWSSRPTPPRWRASSPRRPRPRTSSGWRARGARGGSASTRRSTTARAAATSTRRRTAGARPVVVRAYFAHHQGMSLVALANVVCHDAFVSRFHADPADPGDGAAAPGARPARGHPVGATPGRERDGDPLASGVRVAALPVAAHGERAHALPLERALHHGRHECWRRLQHVARPRDHAAARGPRPPTPAATSSTCATPGRAGSGRATYQPVCHEPDRSTRPSISTRSTFRRRDSDIETQLADHRVVGGRRGGAAADDHQPRRPDARDRGHQLRGDRPGRPEDDFAHPAFGKLFVETEFDSAERRPPVQPPAARRRRIADRGLPRARRGRARLGGAVEWETDRARFIGRGRSPASPSALDGRALSGTTGAVLDPVAALRERIRLAPGAVVRVTFATGVAPDRAAALALARKYRDGSAAVAGLLDGVHPRAHHAAAPGTQRRARDALRPPRVARLRLRRLVHQPRGPRAATRSASSTCGATASRGPADRAGPRRPSRTSLPLVRQMLLAQEYWRVKGLRADVVILNEHPADYLDEMQNILTALLQEPRWAGWRGQAGRHLPAACRRHGRAGPPAPGRGGPRGAARRPRGPGAAAGASGTVAVRPA